ncbi:MAG: DUF4936 family protein [Proteobacteria bacterium]|nr:DUF4936 family protein [Pseudomonadota bacterium]
MRCCRPDAVHHVYVWYRVTGDAGCARAAVTEMMLDIAAETGVVGQLCARADDPTTWMEVYADIDDRAEFDAALARACAAHGVDAYADGGRHAECFSPMATTFDI